MGMDELDEDFGYAPQAREADSYNRRRDIEGWSSSGQLNAGQSGFALQVQAVFPRPRYYTVQFNVILPPNPPVLVLPRAEVLWTVEGGGQCRRLINFGHGTSISGSGQSVNVSMFDYSSDPGPSPYQYSVTALISPGTRPSEGNGRQPTLSSLDTGPDPFNPVNLDVRGQAAIFNALAGPGTGKTWVVPVDCGANTFRVAVVSGGAGALAGNAITIVQIGTAGATVGVADASGLNDWIPLEPSALAVVITNNTANPVTIGLTWGIEG